MGTSILTLPSGGLVTQPITIAGNGDLLSRILSGVQAGELAITSYYQGQALINEAQARAEAAKNPLSNLQPNTVTGAVQGSTDMMPFMLLGGAMLFMMMMSKNK